MASVLFSMSLVNIKFSVFNRYTLRVCLCFVLFGLAVNLTSCVWMKSAQRRILENREEISSGYLGELRRQESGKRQGKLKVNWNQGLDKMYLNNPELIRADYRIADARQRQRQVWRDMVPGLNVGLNDSFTVGELGDAFSDPNFRISSFLSLGNLLELPNEVYERKLFYMGAQLQAEQEMRQQVIALYRLFRQQELLQLEKRALDYEAEVVKDVIGLEGAEVVALRVAYENALDTWEDNYNEWLKRAGDFYMEGYENVDFLPKGLPDITYDPDSLDFSDTGRWGLLQLNLLALEKIAEDGRLLQAYLRYLPRANLAVSAPPLYSNASGQSFDAGRTRLSPSADWSLDSRGSIGQQIDRLKREKPLNDWRKDRRQREEIGRLLEGRKALQELQAELITVRKAIEGYRGVVNAGLVDGPSKQFKQCGSCVRGKSVSPPEK